MGCCGPSSNETKNKNNNNKQNNNKQDNVEGGDSNKTKTMLTWFVVVVLIAGLLIWMI